MLKKENDQPPTTNDKRTRHTPIPIFPPPTYTGRVSMTESILHSIARSRDPLDEFFGPLHDFLWDQHDSGGGFRGPDGTVSLYHTALALEVMAALAIELPRLPDSRYLARFAAGSGLSLTELTSLIRAWRALGHDVRSWLPRLEKFRSTDGGFAHVAGRKQCQVDACFLAACTPINIHDFSCIHACRTGDAYANSPDEPWPSTISTALAMTVQQEYSAECINWLLARHAPKGGFLATPSAQVPDIFSTAAALHVLSSAGKLTPEIIGLNMDFLDSLWSNRGGFQQSWADSELSVETIYYGLLALGYLG